MATKTNTAQLNFLHPIFVDCFAGGGGWSVGFELATNKPMDIAINHDRDAILMHKTNHPYTKHFCEDIFAVSPRDAVQGRHVAWAHFSPDCKHYSKAKGGRPVSKKIRGLAWVVLRWAAEVRPDIMSLENVEEFRTWGPVRKGRPIKSKAGQTFQQWKHQLENLGYEVEYRELTASDYGAPTSRRRLFVIARCDGKPIVWPEPTHGDPESAEVKQGKRKPWKAAADIIDWSLPAPSIFADKQAIKGRYGINAVRPLADNTQRRIIRGIDRFVIRNENPFLVLANEENSVQAPMTMVNNENTAGRSPSEAVGTITTGYHHMLLMPSLIQYHSEKTERVRGQAVTEPIRTIDAANRYGLAAPTLTKYYGSDGHGQSVREPMHTITARDREGVVKTILKPCLPVHVQCPHITKYFSGGFTGTGSNVESPLPTVTAVDHNALAMADLVQMGRAAGKTRIMVAQAPSGEDLQHWPQIRELLNQYCGYVLGEDEILLLAINGCWYFISDIGLRMLTPKELYAANGFPSDYIIERDYLGRPYPKTKQVARCGNAVPPPFATAIVRANAPEYCGDVIWSMGELNSRIAV